MDKKLIQQYGEDILCYRLRTARQKKRMQYEDLDKRLIRLHKEERALIKQKKELGWEVLTPPVQRGWKRCYELRDHVARGRNAEFFNNILQKINTYDWSHRKDFKVKKRRRGKKIYVVKEQKLLRPNERHFLKLGFSDIEKQLFHEEYFYEHWSREPVKRFVFNEPWRFVLRVSPNMITRLKKIDGGIESELQRIDDYLEKNDYRGRQWKLVYGRSYNNWTSKEFYRGYSFFHKSVQVIIGQLEDDY